MGFLYSLNVEFRPAECGFLPQHLSRLYFFWRWLIFNLLSCLPWQIETLMLPKISPMKHQHLRLGSFKEFLMFILEDTGVSTWVRVNKDVILFSPIPCSERVLQGVTLSIWVKNRGLKLHPSCLLLFLNTEFITISNYFQHVCECIEYCLLLFKEFCHNPSTCLCKYFLPISLKLCELLHFEDPC